MDDSRIKDVSALLSAFFDADKIKQGERYSDFFSSWSAIVGSRLAAHSRVADVDKGFLVVEAEHPGWIQLLQLKQSSILEDIGRRYPELSLRGIVFRLSAKASPAAQAALALAERARAVAERKETEEEAPSVDEGTLPPAAEAAEKIDDPAFQELMKSLKKTMQGKE